MKSNSRMNGPTSQTPKKGLSTAKSASQYKARTNFLLEHLASSTIRTNQDAQKSAKERLAETKELLAKGNLWTKEMEMRLTDDDVVLLDGETQDVIEVYPLSSITTVEHLNDDMDLNSVLLFTTQQTENKFAATHLFQSDRVPAAVVATEIMKAASSKEAMPNRFQASKSGQSLPPPPSYAAPQPPALDKERMDLYERSLVAQTIAAFSVHNNENLRRPGKAPKVNQAEGDAVEESVPLDVLEARTNRDVQILNHCIDDIENLVWRTKKSAEAWKKLQKKKGKIKPDNPIAMEARPPPESDFIDAFQKFKHAFNLLGRLRPHIHNPNAAELVHYLFVPLSLLVRCTNGPEKARSVISPLLSAQAIELLQNCLSSKEMELWSALGPNWTETKQSKHFKDHFIPPYAPVFKDGWVPPEYVGGKDIPANISAAVAANAAAVAQMNDQQKRMDDSEPTSPTVLAAAAKFRQLASNQAPKKAIFKRRRILYDFTARNSKELSVKQGDEVAILDDSRQWWCVRNSDGEIGFIPNTILEMKGGETQTSTTTTSKVTTQLSSLPNPPSTAPPPVPTMTVTDVQIKKIETKETSSVNLENRKVPFVELRHVSINKKEDTGPKPPPPPPMSPPPPTLSPSTANVTVTKAVNVNRTESSEQKPSEFQKAILSGGNLKKVNKEAIQKKKEEEKEKRMSSADLLTDELKRRMTHGQGGLTPHVVRKPVAEPKETVVLHPDSETHEVRDWLKSKNFSQTCIQALAWKSAKDLEKMSKEELKRMCGDAEGARVYSQFAVLRSQWNTTTKGNELQFIMQRRKEMVDVNEPKEPTEEGNLRNIVAEARAATEKDVVTIETGEVKRNSYSGTKPVMVTIPQERPRPQSMVIETRVKPGRPRSESNKTPPPTRRKSRGLPFGNEQYIPPPPADYNDKKEIVMTPEQIEAILKEQKKQQELLMEHEKQFALLERLNIQKRELEEHKREYEEHQMRQRQMELEEKQKELEKKIKAQQEEMQTNQSRIHQQNSYMTGMTGMAGIMMPQRQFPVLTPQMQMVPVSGMASQPSYMPIQPVMGYAPAVPQASIPQMVPFNPTIPQ